MLLADNAELVKLLEAAKKDLQEQRQKYEKEQKEHSKIRKSIEVQLKR